MASLFSADISDKIKNVFISVANTPEYFATRSLMWQNLTHLTIHDNTEKGILKTVPIFASLSPAFIDGFFVCENQWKS